MSVTTLEDVNDLVRLIADRPPAETIAEIVTMLELVTQAAVLCVRLGDQVRDVVQAVNSHGKCTLVLQPDSSMIALFREACDLGERIEACS